MLFGVGLAGLRAMLGGMIRMGGRRMGVVSRFFMVARLVVGGGGGVVLGGFGVVLRRVLVALCCFLRHGRRGLKGGKC